jgi:hypothetical protein
MKKLIHLLLLLPVTVTAQSTLPACSIFGEKSNCQGRFTNASGKVFQGEYRAGRFVGVSSDGIRIDSEILNGKLNGQGSVIFRNGSKYVGGFKDGLYNGQGTDTSAYGDEYVGEYKDGSRNGQGTYYFANGWKYVGEWKNDFHHGKGTLFAHDGRVHFQGNFANGTPVLRSKLEQQVPTTSLQATSSERDRLATEVEAERKKRQELEQQLALKKESDQISVTLELERRNRQELEEQLKVAQQSSPPNTSSSLMPLMANRKALVIGNDTYKSVTKLLNAREDAKAIAANLTAVGYKVTLQLDLNEKEMKAALRIFSSQVQGGDEVMFFFAGHGVQLGAANYLLPIDIAGESEAQVKDEAIQLQRVLDDMTEKKAKFTLAMIDACRDNPFKTAGRAIGGRGMAPTTAATGQMVVFSAGTGQQALDRLGNNDKNKNGVFTRTFLKEMQKPGVSIDRIVKNVRNEVAELAKTVGHEQVPAIYDQVLGDFYFKK